MFAVFVVVQNSHNAYPSHLEPLHTKHIDNTDIMIANNFSGKFLSGWATILIENWNHTDGENHNYSL